MLAIIIGTLHEYPKKISSKTKIYTGPSWCGENSVFDCAVS